MFTISRVDEFGCDEFVSVAPNSIEMLSNKLYAAKFHTVIEAETVMNFFKRENVIPQDCEVK